jgi:hypothetical protein
LEPPTAWPDTDKIEPKLLADLTERVLLRDVAPMTDKDCNDPRVTRPASVASDASDVLAPTEIPVPTINPPTTERFSPPVMRLDTERVERRIAESKTVSCPEILAPADTERRHRNKEVPATVDDPSTKSESVDDNEPVLLNHDFPTTESVLPNNAELFEETEPATIQSLETLRLDPRIPRALTLRLCVEISPTILTAEPNDAELLTLS